jgi:hypothetical protein
LECMAFSKARFPIFRIVLDLMVCVMLQASTAISIGTDSILVAMVFD